jgi:predicted dehydrogenase
MKQYLLFIASITFFCRAETNLRWGILSTATIAHRFVDALQQSHRSEVAAVASRELERAQTFAEKHAIPCAYGSYDELLNDSSINVVYIPLPNTMHAEWIIKAAEKGKHVLCEKPIALSMEEMERIQQAAQEHNVIVMEGLMYLHHPQTLVIEEIIRRGIIGDIVHIKAWLERYVPTNNDPLCIHPEFGGGALWNFGIYPLSFAMLITGQLPVHIHASAKTNEYGCDAALESELLFGSCSAHISCNIISPSSKGASIIGTKGRIEIPNPWTPGKSYEETILQVITHDGAETITIPAKNPYLCEIEDMERCILENKEPRIPLEASKAFLKTIIDVYTDANNCCYR